MRDVFRKNVRRLLVFVAASYLGSYVVTAVSFGIALVGGFFLTVWSGVDWPAAIIPFAGIALILSGVSAVAAQHLLARASWLQAPQLPQVAPLISAPRDNVKPRWESLGTYHVTWYEFDEDWKPVEIFAAESEIHP